MHITKVSIKNFKSIDEVEIPFDRVGTSFTKILVGVNESGKSNILEALSFFEAPIDNVEYDHYCNQKNENEDYIDLYYYLDFDKDEEKDLHMILAEFMNY